MDISDNMSKMGVIDMSRPEFGFDLSRLSSEELEKIIGTTGIPHHIKENAAMLYMLREEEDVWYPPSDSDLSEQWTVPTSPRTKQKLIRILALE